MEKTPNFTSNDPQWLENMTKSVNNKKETSTKMNFPVFFKCCMFCNNNSVMTISLDGSLEKCRSCNALISLSG